MSADFFQVTQKYVPDLNQTEQRLFEYVVKNMDDVKDMSIQKFADEQYLSTTTIFRFTQKLGFSGYTEFINSLLVTVHQNQWLEVSKVMRSKVYSEEYLKNIIETIRVMPEEYVERLLELLGRGPNIYFLADENSAAAALYGERLFVGLGYKAYNLTAGYDLMTLPDRVTAQDMIIAISYSGEDATLLETAQRTLAREKPFLVSITRAENNPLESISDLNFYIFADEVSSNGIDLTSSVSAIMILEMLAYADIARIKPPQTPSPSPFQ